MKWNGTVVAAPCSCVAEQGEACSHLAALMIYLENNMRQKGKHLPADRSSTGRLQQGFVPLKWVVQPKSLKEISFRKAEYGKQLPSPSSESAVVTSTSVSLVTSSTADIVGLVSVVQKSVGTSGISHFWVKLKHQGLHSRQGCIRGSAGSSSTSPDPFFIRLPQCSSSICHWLCWCQH